MIVPESVPNRGAQEPLRGEQWFRAAFYQAAVGMAMARLDGRFEEVNERFAEILGYTEEELRQRTFLEVTCLEDLPRTRDHVRQLVEGIVGNYAMEKRYVRKDGGLVWCLTSVTLLRDENGQPSRFIGAIEDITRHKHAEALRSRLAAVVESSDDAIISMTLDAVITTWNQGAERMFGYTAAEVLGKPVTILLPPDREDEEPDILARLRRGERVEHYETMRVRKDGEQLNVSLTVSPIHDARGNVVGASKISRDITERKRAEEALREETRTSELLNNTGMAIASQLNLQSLVQSVTDAATQLSGANFGVFFYNVADDRGESFRLFALSGAPREAFEGFDLPRNTPVFNPAFRGERIVRSGDITKDPQFGRLAPYHGLLDGRLDVRSYLAVPVISRSGEVLGGLFFGHSRPDVFTERSERLVQGVAAQAAIAIDNARLYEGAQREIAERRRAEEALRQAQEQLRVHAERLEEQVSQRTASLQETIGELEAFSYSISHDMRAPLRAMQSFALILAEECGPQLSPEGQSYIRRITRAAERLDRLIQDVLTYSRITRTELSMDSVDVGRLLQDILDSYPMFQAPAAEIRLEGEFPLVLGTAALLTQCISNLLGNAVKFVQPGARARVRVWAEPTAGDRVRLLVNDNGLGIEAGAHERIFGIFDRLSNRYEGTGIGLAIVKKAAERMGGAVGLESQLGKGSTFWLELRRAPQHETR